MDQREEIERGRRNYEIRRNILVAVRIDDKVSMTWITSPEMVAAVSNAGGLGVFRHEFGCNPKEYALSPVPIWLLTPYLVEGGERK